jgi:motility quorum-sensing regulator/GCU-specific mRNA interferase toxin
LEKRIAHYSLRVIKRLIEEENYIVTLSARRSYTKLGLSDSEVLKIINELKASNLYKSMTSYQNHKIWHDVYHSIYRGIKLYIKLQIKENAIIISFKERS